jgi:hypothetical protein
MKAAGALIGLPRELRTRDNMRAIYCENRNGAILQTLFSGPRPFSPPEHAVVRARLVTTRLALSFIGLGSKKGNLLPRGSIGRAY